MLPQPGFLERLRELATKHGTVLIFDEVITGFRHALGGYQSIAGVTPDLTTLGKAMGNGWPISALGGKAELMDLFSTTPGRPAFFAGTFNGHPPTAAAALATIEKLAARAGARARLPRSASGRAHGLAALYARLGVPAVVSGFGSVFVTYFLDGPVRSYDDLLANDVDLFVGYRRELMKDGHLRAAAEPEAQPLLVRAHGRRRRPAARGDGGRGHAIPGGPRVIDSPVACTIDLSRRGSRSATSRSRRSRTPPAGRARSSTSPTIANGDGPTVLVLAGNHGDEYEGQVAALRLLQELQPEQVSGRVIVDPGPLARRVEGEHAQLAVGRELQPLVPRPPRRARRTSSSPTTSRACCSRWPTS